MTSRLIYKTEVHPGIFVVCTSRPTLNGDEYQVQLQHEHGIKYQCAYTPQDAVDIIRQFVSEAQPMSQ